MKSVILGIPIDMVTKEQALDRLLLFLENGKHHFVGTPNPEMVMEAGKDAVFKDALLSADLLIPDGIGLVIASRFGKKKLRERVAGCDLLEALFDRLKDTDKTIYFLGGKPGIWEKAAGKMSEKYLGLKAAGGFHGFFTEAEEKGILLDIKNKKPDVLVVAFGFPKQEKWIAAHKDLPVKISWGAGGTLDTMSGSVRRASPRWRRMGLEWLHRLILEPRRIKRMIKLPAFLVLAFIEQIKGPKKNFT